MSTYFDHSLERAKFLGGGRGAAVDWGGGVDRPRQLTRPVVPLGAYAQQKQLVILASPAS